MIYCDRCVLFSSNDGIGQDWSDKMVQSLLKRPGIGNRCLDPSVYSIRSASSSVYLSSSFCKVSETMQIISAEIYLISVLHISTLMIYFYEKYM